MTDPVRVMIEVGKKKRTVAVPFEWPGWDRSSKTEELALGVLEAYRPRYAEVAEIAGLGREFAAAGELRVVERVEGTGMSDFYGLSARSSSTEQGPMSEAECERRIALLRASWTKFDETAARVSAELRKGPRGGGRERDQLIRHVNGAEIVDFAKLVEVRSPDEVWQHPTPERLWAHRDAFCAAIRDYNARGASARKWTVQLVIRRCAYHMLDHAWEMEDRDLSAGPLPAAPAATAAAAARAAKPESEVASGG